MKVLIDVNHPGHVHFFKYLIEDLKSQGDTVWVTSTKKNISEKLLNDYNIEYTSLGEYRADMIAKFIDFLIIAFKFMFFVFRKKPDYILSISSARPFGGLVSKAKHFIFTDTEHATKQITLFKPFAKRIYTPYSFNNDLGPKQVFYRGSHELAYLHPKRFTPKKDSLKKINMNAGERFFYLRFGSWGATHDVGQKGISNETKAKLVTILKNYGKIIISDEDNIYPEYEQYRLKISPVNLHDVLFYASMYIGEGATTAAEAAILGTTSIYVNSLSMGYIQELQKKELLNHFITDEGLIEYVLEILHSNTNETSKGKAQKYVQNKIDVTSYIVSELKRK